MITKKFAMSIITLQLFEHFYNSSVTILCFGFYVQKQLRDIEGHSGRKGQRQKEGECE
jgi:hypothetical protein